MDRVATMKNRTLISEAYGFFGVSRVANQELIRMNRPRLLRKSLIEIRSVLKLSLVRFLS